MPTPSRSPERPESRWPAAICIVLAGVLYALLPPALGTIPSWVVPALAVLLLVPLVILNPRHLTRETEWSRAISIALGAVLLIGNQLQVVSTVMRLIDGSVSGPTALLQALQVWLTDVIVFALVYWEIDRQGPFQRRMPGDDPDPDFQFPQEAAGRPGWLPVFTDYLYFSLSTMMAFSPTDVMPLSGRAKLLMGLQAFTGFALLALVISRAVNILTG